MSDELELIAKRILKDISTEATGKWKIDSKYIGIRQIQIDKRGSFGERFFAQVLFALYPRRVEYNDGDQGDWDLKIGKLKFEIKTASLDVNKKFQNEGLKKDGDYDGVLFLGLAPDNLYIKFIRTADIPFEKLHNREKAKTGRGYKWDLKEHEMIKVFSLNEIKKEYEKVFIKV